uniref:Core Histone H2A/H2B/H3 domain-containing protein n=1 Tax=Kalanchoe fedtschenkoi TaxID=63787 RepID=A0A7N0TDN8_KALFE
MARTEVPAARGRGTPRKSNVPETPRRKKHRYKPSMKALREIRQIQKSTKLLIPAAPFIRNVREIIFQYSTLVTRWTPEALVSLQAASEDYLIHLFEDGMLCALHARRVTLMKKDFERLVA